MHSPAFALLCWALALLAFTGCIVADPPQYEEPKRTPPILALSRAEPSPFWLVIIDRKSNVPNNDKLLIKVPVRSDDQGEAIWYSVYVDYKGNANQRKGNLFEPPSTIDDENRSLDAEVTMDASVLAGCHQLTLVAAHESSWDRMTQEPYIDAPKDDIAIATWWMNVDPPMNSDPFTLSSCPNQSEVQK